MLSEPCEKCSTGVNAMKVATGEMLCATCRREYVYERGLAEPFPTPPPVAQREVGVEGQGSNVYEALERFNAAGRRRR